MKMPASAPATMGTDRVAHAQWFHSDWHYGRRASPALLALAISLSGGVIFTIIYILSVPAQMEVTVTPSAASLQRTGEVRALPIEAIQDWGRRAVMEFESFDNATDADAAERATEYVHVTFRPAFRAGMTERHKQMSLLWLSRYTIPGAPEVITKGNGRYQVLVPYEQIEYTGRTRHERTAPMTSDRVAILEVVQDLPTDRNADGLWLVGRSWLLREDWKAKGNPPLWSDDGRAAPKSTSAPSTGR